MNDLIAVAIALVCGHMMKKRMGWSHPATIFVLAWAALLSLHALNPLGFTPTSVLTALVISLGLAAFTAGSMLSTTPVKDSHADAFQNDVVAFAVSTALVVIALAYGVYAFRQEVALSMGQVFSSLNPTEILYATAYGGARGGGLRRLLFSLAPLVACLAIYGGHRIHRAWFLLVPLAVTATLQTPGRTVTLILFAAMVPFSLYTRRKRPIKRRRTTVVLALLTTVLAGIAYFNAVGTSLGKNQAISQALGRTNIPDIFVSPLTYVLGGVSALTQAQKLDYDPGNFGRSVYAIARLGEALGLPLEAPNVVSGYVHVPIPFNVYTAFGDVWLDFGWLGLLPYFALIGWLLCLAHRRASLGDVKWAWVASMLISVLSSSAISIRLFYLDSVTLLILGWVLFSIIVPRRINRQPTARPMDTLSTVRL